MSYIDPDLAVYEEKVFSQFGEDGIIRRIAHRLGIQKGTFFEFGIGKDAEGILEGNFILLRNQGWTGVFLDGQENLEPEHDVRREFITALNINVLYQKHDVPKDLDFMSIDVDGQDFWIWMALRFRPKVMVIEVNGGLYPDKCVSIQFDVNHIWDGTIYHGASLRAFDKLAKAKGYTLVYTNGINAFFVRDDLVSNKADFSVDRLHRWGVTHREDTKNRPWVEI